MWSDHVGRRRTQFCERGCRGSVLRLGVQRGTQLLGVRGSLVRRGPADLFVARVEPVACPAREDVHVKVPDVLAARGLVVLAHRCAGAAVRSAHRGRDALRGSVDRAEQARLDRVDVLDVLDRDHDRVAVVPRPPLRRHECARQLVAPHHVRQRVVRRLDAAQQAAERAVIAGWLVLHAHAATTGLDTTPIPSTSTSTTSPSFIDSFGSRAQPTPGGVPVRIRSPGSSVKTRDTYATRNGTSKIRSSVLPSWITSPLSRCTTRRPLPLPSSDTGTSSAESGQNVSKPFARVHWLSAYWMLRAETSFATRYPATKSSASSRGMRLTPRPISTASSASESTCVASGGITIGSPGATSVFSNLPKMSGSVGGSSPSSAACSA